MNVKDTVITIGRFFGIALLVEAALMLIVGVVAFLFGVRTWGLYGTWLFFFGLIALVGGMASSYSDNIMMVSTRTRFSQDHFKVISDLMVERRKTSGNEAAYILLVMLVGGSAIALGLMLSSA